MVDTNSTSILSSEDLLHEIRDKLNAEKWTLKEHRIIKHWIKCIEMKGILRMFIKAKRIGDWNWHIQAVQEVLLYFSAAGHNFYTKSAYINLQKMQQLPESHCDIHTGFLNGYHAIDQSDLYWTWTSTYLVIEQVLMRSIKTTWDLTRDRGMADVQCLTLVVYACLCRCQSFNARIHWDQDQLFLFLSKQLSV